MIAPCRVLYGCQDAGSIKDAWNSPLMGPQYSAHLKAVVFLETPSNVEWPGGGPLKVAVKKFVAFRMDPFGEMKDDWVHRAIHPKNSIRQGKGILFECRLQDAMKVRKAVDGLPEHVGGGFNPEILVPGCKKEEARAVIHLIGKTLLSKSAGVARQNQAESPQKNGGGRSRRHLRRPGALDHGIHQHSCDRQGLGTV